MSPGRTLKPVSTKTLPLAEHGRHQEGRPAGRIEIGRKRTFGNGRAVTQLQPRLKGEMQSADAFDEPGILVDENLPVMTRVMPGLASANCSITFTLALT